MSGKTIKPADMKAKTDDQLADQVMQLRREQMNLRFQKAQGQLQNTARVRAVRRDIARAKTVQHQRRQDAEQQGSK